MSKELIEQKWEKGTKRWEVEHCTHRFKSYPSNPSDEYNIQLCELCGLMKGEKNINYNKQLSKLIKE